LLDILLEKINALDPGTWHNRNISNSNYNSYMITSLIFICAFQQVLSEFCPSQVNGFGKKKLR